MNTPLENCSIVASYSIYPLTPESVPCAPQSGSLRDRLILPELGYRFTQKVTRCWDWQADRASQPACTKGLLQILERLCAAPSEIQEVAL